MLHGIVLTACALDAAARARVEERFSSLLGQDVVLEEHLEPSLLGGIRVEIDGRVYDGSLRAQLTDVLKALQGEREAETRGL